MDGVTHTHRRGRIPDDGIDADTLINNAEAALKKAKASRDRFLFYAQKMTETVAMSLGIENRLRRALERQEFVLHYQPKVNIVSGKLTGAEALIRWNDPVSGLTRPGRFIPILEETGLIHDVGRWALGKAIEDYQRWRSAGLPAVRIAYLSLSSTGRWSFPVPSHPARAQNWDGGGKQFSLSGLRRPLGFR